jgi:hypothetical protein
LFLLLGLVLPTGAVQGADSDLWDYSLEELLEMRVSAMDHSLQQREMLVGYQYMNMEMRGIGKGTSDVGREEFFASTSFTVAPLDMDMEMHMLHFMYSPAEDWTLMLMAPYTKLRMKHEMRMGGGMGMATAVRFRTDNSGIGDLELSALNTVFESDTSRLILKTGLSLPTGSLSNKDNTPMGRKRLPYPMRLGSGTFDLLPGAIYIFETCMWNIGADFEASFRLGDNRYDYDLGSRYELNTWVMRRVSDHVALTARANAATWDNINGADEALNPMMAPMADPHMRGGKQIDLFGGINLFADSGKLRGHRLLLEAGHPVYEDLDGFQLKTRWHFMVDWVVTF